MELVTSHELKNKGNYQFVATIGFFDGLHKGHQKLFNSLFENNKKSLEKTLVITFDKKHNIENQLFPLSEKINQFAKMGIDYLLILSIDEIKNYSANEFIIFLKELNIKKLIVGEEFRFGHNAMGTIQTLKNSGIDIITKLLINDETGEKISSSIIREDLNKNNIQKANCELGYNYYLCGQVISGDKLGRTINFPTANIITDHFIPAKGVYLTRTTVEGEKYLSITNIGIRPTLDKTELRIETYINNFNQDIYGQKIKVEFIKFLRTEKKFDDLADLKKQLNIDLQKLKEYQGIKSKN